MNHSHLLSLRIPRNSLVRFAALGAAAMVSAGALQAENLLQNGDFENGPTGWWGKGLKSGGIVAEKPAEGANCLKITESYACQDKRPVEGGKSYKVTLRIRTEDAPDGSVYVQLSYRGEGVKPNWYGSEVVNINGRTEKAVFVTGGTQNWKEYSFVTESPANASEVLLYLRKISETPGAAYFDDVKIEPVG